MNAFIWGMYYITIIVYYILTWRFSLFPSDHVYGGSLVAILCNICLKCSWFPHYTTFLLLINFRVLKHKQFEENVTTTGNSVKDTSNKCSNITTECRSTAVVVALAILLGISVSAQLITCVFIYCKGLGRCKHLRYGR